MDKEKITQIYEAIADMTIEMINKERKKSLYLDEFELEMVRTTQSLYETINHANQPVIATDFGGVVPEDSSGAKYSHESSSIARPITNRNL